MSYEGSEHSQLLVYSFGGASLHVISIGDHYDQLNWNFEQPISMLVTQVLHDCLRNNCDEKIPQSDIWQWTINQRLIALLSIVKVVDSTHCSINVSCPKNECGELVDLDFDLASLPKHEAEMALSLTLSSENEADVNVQLRLPSGQDQLRWLKQKKSSTLICELQMAQDLVVKIDGKQKPENWKMPISWLSEIANFLSKNDPYTDFQFSTQCPYCYHPYKVSFDIEDHLLGVIRHKWHQLLEDIHLLAFSYHWTETEIFSVPRERRQYYLECIHKVAAL